jgi:peptidoglycan/xylan/chitin deacetylase (PgdA/CDA1 family)
VQGPLKRVLAALAAVALGGCNHAASRAHGASPLPHTPVTAAVVPVHPAALAGVVLHGSRTRPLVALTFDTNMTDAMLGELAHHRVESFVNRKAIDALDAMQVPATIFLAGKWIERYPEEARRLAADPLFELASHSYAHRAFHAPCYGLGRAMPTGEMAADVQRSEDLLHGLTEHPTAYFRFPGGCYDQAALDAVAPTGVNVIQYDVASGDAFGTSVRTIVDHVLRSAQNGSIVVMHLTGGNTAPRTAEALPAVVNGLRARGLRLVKVSELLAGGELR